MAGFVGRWPGAVGPWDFRTWSGTALGRRDGRLASRCRTGRLAAMPDALAGPLLQGDDRNGPSGRHGRTEETHKHYNGLTISPMPANSRYAW